jgi:alpha-N-arabinofuranosidase
VAGLQKIPGGDDRFYNNIFVGPASGLVQYDKAAQPMQMAGNVFLKGAKPSKSEQDPLVLSESDPAIKLVEKADGLYIEIVPDKAWAQKQRQLVTTELLGKAKVPDLPYEQPDGSPLRIDTDYLGKKRPEQNPTAGPFENPGQGELVLKVWQ